MKTMKRTTIIALLLTAGCAHPYSLKPLTETPEVLNGIELTSLVTKKCVLQAGYEESTPEEMLIHLKVLNKSEYPFDVDFSYFSLAGTPESLKESPLHAEDPEKYLKDLNLLAEIQDSRTHMDSYQGIEALGTLGGEKSDHQIDAAKDLYEEKQKEAEASKKKAVAFRKRVSMIQPVALRKTNLKSGETAEGAIVIRAAFKDEGVVTLESSHPACKGSLRFMLRK